jgi:hypothetical protein
MGMEALLLKILSFLSFHGSQVSLAPLFAQIGSVMDCRWQRPSA